MVSMPFSMIDLDTLLDHYDAMLPANVKPRLEPEPGTRLRHIKWMIGEMRNMEDEAKFMRWLGFIQCRLILDGRTTVQRERDFTRPLLTDLENEAAHLSHFSGTLDGFKGG